MIDFNDTFDDFVERLIDIYNLERLNFTFTNNAYSQEFSEIKTHHLGAYIFRKNNSEIFYIGMSGKIKNDGTLGEQRLIGRLTKATRKKFKSTKEYFENRLEKYGDLKIECLIINNKEANIEEKVKILSPALLESLLLQKYFFDNNKLPEDNDEFK